MRRLLLAFLLIVPLFTGCAAYVEDEYGNAAGAYVDEDEAYIGVSSGEDEEEDW